jgi:photosystem II stability/assembly factor-like uncharacterized protein
MRRAGARAAVLALPLALALAGTSARPGLAQRAPPPRLTFTPQPIDFGSVLFGVSFADSRNGHVVGAYHAILGTTDGGQTWVRRENPLPTRDPRTALPGPVDPRDQALLSVAFPDATHGFAAASDDGILATSDGGVTWTLKRTPRPRDVDAVWIDEIPSAWNFTSLSFVSPSTGYVVGFDGLILATSDAGATWRYQGDPRYGILWDVSFVDEVHGHVVGDGTGRSDQVVYTTLLTADGRKWEPRSAAGRDARVAANNLSAVAMTTVRHAVAIGNGGRAFVTFDEGKTWRVARNGTNERLAGLAFAQDGRRGLAVGAVDFQGELRAIILATTDRGQSWSPYPAPEYGDFHAVDFADDRTAFAVGCVEHTSPCRNAAVVKIDFPQLEPGEEDETSSSTVPVLPLAMVGAALLVGATGLLVSRRRR